MDVRRLACVCSAALLLGFVAVGRPQEPEEFGFDDAAREVAALWTRGPESYAISILPRSGEQALLAWLEYVPGAGDQLWTGRLDGSRLVDAADFGEVRGRAGPWLSEPSWTPGAEPAVPVLSFIGHGRDGTEHALWSARYAAGEGPQDLRRELGPGGRIVSHRAAPGRTGARGASFLVQETTPEGHRLRLDGARVGSLATGAWSPDLARSASGSIDWLVWDAYDGEQFAILGQRRGPGEEEAAPQVIARGAHFLGRPRVAAAPDGGAWIVFEAGAPNWGRDFRGRIRAWNNVRDDYGPLHRFRSLRVLRWNPDGTLAEPAEPLPMPGFAAQRDTPGLRAGAQRLGVFYERPEIAVDGHGRLWVVWRHFRAWQLACQEDTRHHIESGWRIYAQSLDAEGWSERVVLDPRYPQRDGTQRLSVAAIPDGVLVAWDHGRTDRRDDPRERGVAVARVTMPLRAAGAPAVRSLGSPKPHELARERPAAETVEQGGVTYRLAFGDLHRHTDLSLCFPFYDGSLDDAYRYATEVAQLDFLGITDHTRDIAQGEVDSQLWWRCLKAVQRHAVEDRFFPYFAYERSRGTTDHNVISLRDDMLRPFQPPLEEFWKEIDDGDTFTIPHNPIVGRAWEISDDARRPLLEIYQGLRDQVSDGQAHQGLERGHHFGFIASSDHMSTHASYACVWTPEWSREGLFRSMQARRTYGATDRIRLLVLAGEHWMGERFETGAGEVELEVRWRETAPVRRLRVVVDGEVFAAREPGAERRWSVAVPVPATGVERWAYVVLEQEDGNRAWSSPLWFKQQPAGAR